MDLYYTLISPPCRSVMMTAKAVGVDLNLKNVNLKDKEHLKPEFLKINPQHSIPTLVDNGFALWESRAIMIYLAEKYSQNDSLYPKCPKAQAVINQRLYFDATMYQRCYEYIYPQIFAKEPADPEKFKKMEDAASLLEIFLQNQKYVAGEVLTIADITLVVTVSTYELCKFDISKYPNVEKWYKLCKKEMPGIEINQRGVAEEYEQYFKDLQTL